MTNARELTGRLADLLSREHHAMADFLVALADFDRRRLWFFHVSKQEAKAVSAELQPATAAPHRDVVTAVRPPQVRAHTEIALTSPADPREQAHPARALDPEQSVHLDEPDASARDAPAPRTLAPAQRDSVEPLTADLSRLHVTVSRRFLQKLEAATAALSYKSPGASAAEILEAGLDLVLAEHAKRNGFAKKPRKEPPPARSDRIPAHVKRAVWARDGGCCQWRVDSGGICGSTLRLQFDHVAPRAFGGPSTVENVRLLCAVHNNLAARRVFGDAWMDRFTRKREADPVAEPVVNESG